MICDPFPPFAPSSFHIKFATQAWERAGAAALRRQVFCEEQRIFAHDDRDALDAGAITLVALSSFGIAPVDVVGTVRIHRDQPGVRSPHSGGSGTSEWSGSRLAVAKPFRRIGTIGTSLIRLAVMAAHARGCRVFHAHVQSANAPLFHALHWTTLQEVEVYGHPHHLMQADLAYYPPIADPEVGFLSHLKHAA
jgi:putative N-acetyltransferase (TIGR04045 family)